MEPDERKMLTQTLKLEEENNKLLKKINRSIQWGRFVKAVYWLVIIGSTVGAYYLLQPIFESFKGTLGGLSSGVQNIQKAGNSLPNIGKLLEGLNIQ